MLLIAIYLNKFKVTYIVSIIILLIFPKGLRGASRDIEPVQQVYSKYLPSPVEPRAHTQIYLVCHSGESRRQLYGRVYNLLLGSAGYRTQG